MIGHLREGERRGSEEGEKRESSSEGKNWLIIAMKGELQAEGGEGASMNMRGKDRRSASSRSGKISRQVRRGKGQQ